MSRAQQLSMLAEIYAPAQLRHLGAISTVVLSLRIERFR